MNPILEQLDTAGLAQGGQPTKALVIVNESQGAFHGIGRLVADFRIPDALPVTVFDPQGNVVPSRLVEETLGPRDATDGKRRWKFVLEFFCDAPPRSAIGYGAIFADTIGTHASGRQWESRRLGGVLEATETECRTGSLSNPCAL
jgi:hypothetical protein